MGFNKYGQTGKVHWLDRDYSVMRSHCGCSLSGVRYTEDPTLVTCIVCKGHAHMKKCPCCGRYLDGPAEDKNTKKTKKGKNRGD